MYFTAVYRTAVCMTAGYIIALQCLHCTGKNVTDSLFKTEVNISVVYMTAVFLTAVYLTEVFGAAVHLTAVYIAAIHLTIVYFTALY